MTIPRFGRVTPLQCDMLAFAGHVLSRNPVANATDEQRIAAITSGHAALVERVGRDLGYELQPWHDLLFSHPDHRAEYRFRYAWSTVKAAIESAFVDPDRVRLLAMSRPEG
jgi:hypothetical protein